MQSCWPGHILSTDFSHGKAHLFLFYQYHPSPYQPPKWRLNHIALVNEIIRADSLVQRYLSSKSQSGRTGRENKWAGLCSCSDSGCVIALHAGFYVITLCKVKCSLLQDAAVFQGKPLVVSNSLMSCVISFLSTQLQHPSHSKDSKQEGLAFLHYRDCWATWRR